ncbi:MAG: sugar ABC transporter ATP-binding protein [Pseudomonadota bacterium]
MEGLSKSFFGVEVLHQVSFALHQGETIGLVGENGSGKSTMMNILGGIHKADAGSITLAGEAYVPGGPRDAQAAGLAFIHQELNLFENLSIEENVFVSGFPRRWGRLPLIDRGRISERTRQLLDMVDVRYPPNTLVGRLSQGERQLVEIAKALSVDARIILFDEPTTSLTRRETAKLFEIMERLRVQGIAVIYVSHILGDVLRVCDGVQVLRDGHLVGGGTRDEMTIESLISMMVGRQIENLFPERDTKPSVAPALTVEGVTQPGVVKDVSFILHESEVLGLAGLMGAGRSELARILFGLDPFEAGSISVHGEVLETVTPETCMARGMAFLTEDRRGEGLLMEASIIDNAGLPSLQSYANERTGWIDRTKLAADVADVSRRLQVNTTDYGSMLVKNLSGGNQQKVVIGKWLLRHPKVFLLDEPTRGIDVGAKYEIYKIVNDLVAEGAAILFISSEMEELIGMCDRILVMNRGEITGIHHRHEFDNEKILETAMRTSLDDFERSH